jgi:acetyl-CoA carboxylase biotin carboxyl carrier protein
VSINFQELRELLGAIAQTDITELILKNDEFELTVRKSNNVTDRSVATVSSMVVDKPPTNTAAPPPSPTVAPLPPAPPPESKNWLEIASPMVGTFYRAPAPDEEPFVNVGDRITKSDTVCIIEAMKLMNEIEGEISGQVMEIVVQNGEPVEFGQTLMRIKPD